MSSVWPSGHREDLALLQPCADHSLSVALWLTRRWDHMTSLVWNSSEAKGSWSPSPLIVTRDSFSIWAWARIQTARSTAYFNGCLYTFLIYHYITIYVWVPHFYYLSPLVDCWSSVSLMRIIYKFCNVCPFDYTAFAVSGKVGIL